MTGIWRFRAAVLTLVGALALTTAGGYVAYDRFAPRPAAAARVTAAEVARGTVVSSVTATGSVATPAQSKLTFKSSGRLTQLLVNVGDVVPEGQVVARIDDADLQVEEGGTKGKEGIEELWLLKTKKKKTKTKNIQNIENKMQ